MAVLSDSEIRRRIAAGELVPGADPALVSACGYAFVAGAAFHPGSDDPPIRFPAEVVVKPGEMIWIRTREQVKMPADIGGFWWQTNELSRRGLMLVNMSMVDPGYEGDLACLFVNFGKSRIPINADTVIAKMVFMTIAGPVERPFVGRFDRAAYDARLRELSIDQPASFLQVGELASDLSHARTEALSAVAAKATEAAQDAAKAIAAERDAELAKFRGNLKDSVQASFWWAAAAVALLTLATVGADWIEGKVFPDVPSAARKAADEALRDRLSVPAAPQGADQAALTAEIRRLDARVAALEKGK